MWHTALPESRPSSSKPLSGHLLCGSYFFYSWIRWLRARHMAFPALHGRYDLYSVDCSSDTSTNLTHPVDYTYCCGAQFVIYFLLLRVCTVWTAGIHMDGKAKARRLLFVSQSTFRKTRRRMQHNASSRHNYGFSKWILCASIAPSWSRKYFFVIFFSIKLKS